MWKAFLWLLTSHTISMVVVMMLPKDTTARNNVGMLSGFLLLGVFWAGVFTLLGL